MILCMEANPKDYFLQKYEECECQRLELLSFVELVATGKRPDGTYNYCREALGQIAKDLLKKHWHMKSAQIEGDSEIGAGMSSDIDIRRIKSCENCGRPVDIETEAGHRAGCDFVWGRRGWRQLGSYDG